MRCSLHTVCVCVCTYACVDLSVSRGWMRASGVPFTLCLIFLRRGLSPEPGVVLSNHVGLNLISAIHIKRLAMEELIYPSIGEIKDQWVCGVYWLAILAQSMRSRFSEFFRRHCGEHSLHTQKHL